MKYNLCSAHVCGYYSNTNYFFQNIKAPERHKRSLRRGGQAALSICNTNKNYRSTGSATCSADRFI